LAPNTSISLQTTTTTTTTIIIQFFIYLRADSTAIGLLQMIIIIQSILYLYTCLLNSPKADYKRTANKD
jgi:hypothetical protein